ncbi:MAG: alpha/beta fold hydrolase [Nocardioides sp.]
MDRITSYTHDGLTFDVRDEGPVGGPVAVLLHGFPERSSSWRAVSPLLHETGIRTLAPDQRGYSPGARPSRVRDHRLPLLAGDVVALAERVGEPVHLVGHDWGAAVAWYLAAHHPTHVRTLTAVSVPHPRAFLRAARDGQLRRSWYMALFQLPGVMERLARRPGGRVDESLLKGGMTRDDVARFRREIVDDGALPGALRWYRALPFTDPRLARARVAVPTTFVWSDGDVAIVRRGAELTGEHVDAPYRLEILSGVSHWIPTEAPEALAKAVIARILG